MIWTEIVVEADAIHEWVGRAYDRRFPEMYRFEDMLRPPDTVMALAQAGWRVSQIDAASPAVRIEFRVVSEASLDRLTETTLFAAEQIDKGRRFFERSDLNADEQPPPFVIREFTSSIDGVTAIGPGGRATVYSFEGIQLADVVVRRRTETVPSVWRDRDQLTRDILQRLRDEPTMARLRAAFGYYEMSPYERQSLLRPIFAFVLDLPAADDGPRWRLAFVEPATTSETIPPSAGIENASTGCL